MEGAVTVKTKSDFLIFRFSLFAVSQSVSLDNSRSTVFSNYLKYDSNKLVTDFYKKPVQIIK